MKTSVILSILCNSSFDEQTLRYLYDFFFWMLRSVYKMPVSNK